QVCIGSLGSRGSGGSGGRPHLRDLSAYAMSTPGTVRVWTVIDDPGGAGEKAWSFETNTAAAILGLLTTHEHREQSTHASKVTTANTWVADAAGNLYIGMLLITLDGTLQKKSAQTMDNYGNLTSLQLYDFGNLSTPVRIYTNTY